MQGGKLAGLLSQARSAVTINSTAAQQALWRGLPVKAMGRSVYAKPGLVSGQSLEDFLRRPAPPDQARSLRATRSLGSAPRRPGYASSRSSSAVDWRLASGRA